MCRWWSNFRSYWKRSWFFGIVIRFVWVNVFVIGWWLLIFVLWWVWWRNIRIRVWSCLIWFRKVLLVWNVWLISLILLWVINFLFMFIGGFVKVWYGLLIIVFVLFVCWFILVKSFLRCVVFFGSCFIVLVVNWIGWNWWVLWELNFGNWRIWFFKVYFVYYLMFMFVVRKIVVFWENWFWILMVKSWWKGWIVVFRRNIWEVGCCSWMSVSRRFWSCGLVLVVKSF